MSTNEVGSRSSVARRVGSSSEVTFDSLSNPRPLGKRGVDGSWENRRMAAYLIADTKVTDPEGYERYKAQARPIAERYGGEYLARGGDVVVDDDDLWSPVRLVVIRFPDLRRAEEFLASDEYAPVKALRREFARSTVVVVEGE